MNAWPNAKGIRKTYYAGEQVGRPNTNPIYPYGAYNVSGVTSFPSVTENKYFVRSIFSGSGTKISCYEIDGYSFVGKWSANSECFGGVIIANNLVVIGDAVFSIDTGEPIMKVDHYLKDIRTRSVFYKNILFIRAGGRGFYQELGSTVVRDCEVGPLDVFDGSMGLTVGILNKNVVVSDLNSIRMLWSYELVELASSDKQDGNIAICMCEQKIYVISQGEIISLSPDGALLNRIEYFESMIKEQLLACYPDLIVNVQYFADQVATDGVSMVLVRYGHPGWIICLDMKNWELKWCHITSDQADACITGNFVFTTSENYHRGYDIENGDMIWKSKNKSKCVGLVVGNEFLGYEDNSGNFELFAW